MKCPICNTRTGQYDLFCGECGTRVVRSATERQPNLSIPVASPPLPRSIGPAPNQPAGTQAVPVASASAGYHHASEKPRRSASKFFMVTLVLLLLLGQGGLIAWLLLWKDQEQSASLNDEPIRNQSQIRENEPGDLNTDNNQSQFIHQNRKASDWANQHNDTNDSNRIDTVSNDSTFRSKHDRNVDNSLNPDHWQGEQEQHLLGQRLLGQGPARKNHDDSGDDSNWQEDEVPENNDSREKNHKRLDKTLDDDQVEMEERRNRESNVENNKRFVVDKKRDEEKELEETETVYDLREKRVRPPSIEKDNGRADEKSDAPDSPVLKDAARNRERSDKSLLETMDESSLKELISELRQSRHALVVYYWSANIQNSVTELEEFSKLCERHLNVISVCVDSTQNQAVRVLSKSGSNCKRQILVRKTKYGVEVPLYEIYQRTGRPRTYSSAKYVLERIGKKSSSGKTNTSNKERELPPVELKEIG